MRTSGTDTSLHDYEHNNYTHVVPLDYIVSQSPLVCIAFINVFITLLSVYGDDDDDDDDNDDVDVDVDYYYGVSTEIVFIK